MTKIENNKIKDFNESKFKKLNHDITNHPEHEYVTKDIMRKFDSIFRRFKKHFGRVVDVPVRLNGKTGRGVFGECHSNVAELVKQVGGKCVRGYMLYRVESTEATGFIWHSVWQTPEGKLVDVTMSSSKDYVDQKSIQFIPVITFDPLKHDYWFVDDFAVFDDRHKGLAVREGTAKNFNKNVPFNWFKKFNFKLVTWDRAWTESSVHKKFIENLGENPFNINIKKVA